MKVVLDVETTVDNPQKITDNMPWSGKNKLVSVQYKIVGTKDEDFVAFNHSEFTGSQKESFDEIQSILDKTTLLIGHNLKFDLIWLRECGFKYDGAVWDTMIFEYLQIKGMKTALSLKATAEKYGLEIAKSDFLMDNFKAGINTDEMPLAGLTEYGMLDIYLTEEVFIHQQEKQDPDTVFMRPALELTNEYMPVLVDMERAGAYIDLEELHRLEVEYKQEHQQLLEGLDAVVQEVMGDKPYNLSSPSQLSEIVYGFSMKDKKVWAEIFNVGSEVRNGVRKKKYQPNLSDREVDQIIRDNTIPLYKTIAEQCPVCVGKGYIQKMKVNGEPYKKTNICQHCKGEGFVYHATEVKAGLGLKHPGSRLATVNGFAVDKHAITLILERGYAALDRLPENQQKRRDKVQLAISFLEALQRLGSVENYLNSFIKKIKENQVNNILHVNFNQCITATGRLSSTFHNLPKGGVFPVKKAVVSRFKGGKILSCDLAQIDFRTAVYLAQCEKGMKFLDEKQDIHMVSSRFYNPDAETITKEMRTKAKAYTFRPLFGGQDDYAEHFYSVFPGIRVWHQKLINEALTTKQTKSPFGRIFSYPNVERKLDKNGNPSCSFFTQISNYQVQGAATGDIMPIVVISVYRQMKALGVKSRLILTVHDDLTADIHPDEIDLMLDIFRKGFNSVYDECKRRYGLDINVPIDYELSMGDNWMDKKEVV